MLVGFFSQAARRSSLVLTSSCCNQMHKASPPSSLSPPPSSFLPPGHRGSLAPYFAPPPLLLQGHHDCAPTHGLGYGSSRVRSLSHAAKPGPLVLRWPHRSCLQQYHRRRLSTTVFTPAVSNHHFVLLAYLPSAAQKPLLSLFLQVRVPRAGGVHDLLLPASPPRQVHRLPVIDKSGLLVGIVSRADLFEPVDPLFASTDPLYRSSTHFTAEGKRQEEEQQQGGQGQGRSAPERLPESEDYQWDNNRYLF